MDQVVELTFIVEAIVVELEILVGLVPKKATTELVIQEFPLATEAFEHEFVLEPNEGCWVGDLKVQVGWEF